MAGGGTADPTGAGGSDFGTGGVPGSSADFGNFGNPMGDFGGMGGGGGGGMGSDPSGSDYSPTWSGGTGSGWGADPYQSDPNVGAPTSQQGTPGISPTAGGGTQSDQTGAGGQQGTPQQSQTSGSGGSQKLLQELQKVVQSLGQKQGQTPSGPSALSPTLSQLSQQQGAQGAQGYGDEPQDPGQGFGDEPQAQTAQGYGDEAPQDQAQGFGDEQQQAAGQTPQTAQNFPQNQQQSAQQSVPMPRPRPANAPQGDTAAAGAAPTTPAPTGAGAQQNAPAVTPASAQAPAAGTGQTPQTSQAGGQAGGQGINPVRAVIDMLTGNWGDLNRMAAQARQGAQGGGPGSQPSYGGGYDQNAPYGPAGPPAQPGQPGQPGTAARGTAPTGDSSQAPADQAPTDFNQHVAWLAQRPGESDADWQARKQADWKNAPNGATTDASGRPPQQNPDGSMTPTDGLPGGAAASAPPPTQGYGSTPQQQNRPRQYKTTISVQGGGTYTAGSGGGQFPSLPYGRFHYHPGAYGRVGRRIGALGGISDSNNPGDNTVHDPITRGMRGAHAIRAGVLIHRDVSGGRYITNGCIGVDRNKFDAFSNDLNRLSRQGPVDIINSPQGIQIVPAGQSGITRGAPTSMATPGRVANLASSQYGMNWV